MSTAKYRYKGGSIMNRGNQWIGWPIKTDLTKTYIVYNIAKWFFFLTVLNKMEGCSIRNI